MNFYEKKVEITLKLAHQLLDSGNSENVSATFVLYVWVPVQLKKRFQKLSK